MGRAWSILKGLYTPNRNRLHPRLLEKLMRIRWNLVTLEEMGHGPPPKHIPWEEWAERDDEEIAAAEESNIAFVNSIVLFNEEEPLDDAHLKAFRQAQDPVDPDQEFPENAEAPEPSADKKNE